MSTIERIFCAAFVLMGINTQSQRKERVRIIVRVSSNRHRDLCGNPLFESVER